MAKIGRPEENLYDKWIRGREEAISAACRNGATVNDLVKIIGCGKTAFHRIKNNYVEFSELLKISRDEADLIIENALFKRARGFEYDESTEEVRQGGANGDIISVKKTKKVVPPDVTAAMAWLRNRKRVEWNAPIKTENENNNLNKNVILFNIDPLDDNDGIEENNAVEKED